MHAIILFLFHLTDFAVGFLLALVVIYVILSWLIAFNVVNMRNPTVYRLTGALEGVVAPMLRPIQRFLPSLGGMDFSPIIFVVVLGLIRTDLLPAFFGFLDRLLGGGATVI